MTGRRILYSLVLAGAFCFFIAYQKWLAWFLFTVVLALPGFSFLLSLPAMLTARLRIDAPNTITVGQPLELTVLHRCPLPTPMWRCALIVERPMTGQRWKMNESASLPTSHCGTLMISVRKARIFDYTGLSKLPVRFRPAYHKITVRPTPVPIPELPPLNRCLDRSWKPKPGGGFAENHELRLYRPGDSIQQIHWKLSAKTGSLILREPMEPVRSRVLLRMDLTGTPSELDTKLGQLLWLGQNLLEKDVHFQIQCLTGNGVEQWPVSSAATLDSTIDDLLSRPQATDGSLQGRPESAGWQFYIGGGSHESQ